MAQDRGNFHAVSLPGSAAASVVRPPPTHTLAFVHPRLLLAHIAHQNSASSQSSQDDEPSRRRSTEVLVHRDASGNMLRVQRRRGVGASAQQEQRRVVSQPMDEHDEDTEEEVQATKDVEVRPEDPACTPRSGLSMGDVAGGAEESATATTAPRRPGDVLVDGSQPRWHHHRGHPQA